MLVDFLAFSMATVSVAGSVDVVSDTAGMVRFAGQKERRRYGCDRLCIVPSCIFGI